MSDFDPKAVEEIGKSSCAYFGEVAQSTSPDEPARERSAAALSALLKRECCMMMTVSAQRFCHLRQAGCYPVLIHLARLL